jgi:microcompartment protein CcmL/EutN
MGNNEMRTLGMIETRGFTAMVEASDAMVKAAKGRPRPHENVDIALPLSGKTTKKGK